MGFRDPAALSPKLVVPVFEDRDVADDAEHPFLRVVAAGDREAAPGPGLGMLVVTMAVLVALRRRYVRSMRRAGTPAQNSPAGTSRLTRAMAPMVAPSPMVTPGRTSALAPMLTPDPMVTGPRWYRSTM